MRRNESTPTVHVDDVASDVTIAAANNETDKNECQSRLINIMYNYYNTLNKLFLVCDTCNSGLTSVTSIHVADQGTVNNSVAVGHHSVNVNDPVAYLGRLDVIDF